MFDKKCWHKCWLWMKMYAFPFKRAVVCCDNRYNPQMFIRCINKG